MVHCGAGAHGVHSPGFPCSPWGFLGSGCWSAMGEAAGSSNALLYPWPCRVFLALCDNPKDGGTIVAQGGGKALIPLALEGTDVGKVKVAHALAKIAAVSNPDIAFPGERVYEVVRPLVRLLDTQRDGLQNYEALLGLTNLSGRSDKLR
ncbi:protein unc-45 homolog B-like [Marmota marmota marmota]|uniref:protein unc-45 homolog B-like n=1 Tax=Marmota marmota marmota TaxID=9994 RepID=UPI0007626E9C|nr:protein unc-45 homolog B-like [Marmota marmota marmota]